MMDGIPLSGKEILVCDRRASYRRGQESARSTRRQLCIGSGRQFRAVRVVGARVATMGHRGSTPAWVFSPNLTRSRALAESKNRTKDQSRTQTQDQNKNRDNQANPT